MSFNILVVDDNSVMRTVLVRTLRMSGLPLGEIHQAANGREALAVLEKHWVDLALVDINMPVMNGEELIDRVRDNPEMRDLAIIVVSTESSQTRIERVMRQGARFVHKPFTPEYIRGTVLDITGVGDGREHEVGAASGGEFDF
jgi:two-component system chemotaxis response regulator CheY